MPHLLPFADYGEAIGDASAVIRANATSSGLDAAVPTCPGWTVGDLVAHVGGVHRWCAAELSGGVSGAAAGGADGATAASDLLDWFDDGLVEVLNALVAAPESGGRLSQSRRIAHETGVHAIDAMAARLGRTPTASELWLRPSLAADAVDELVGRVLPGGAVSWQSGDGHRVVVRASDVGRSWTLQIASDGSLALVEGDGGDVTVTGTARALFAGLWNRGDGLAVAGRDGWLADWRRLVRVG